NPVFKMTHITGGGAKNSTERVWFGPTATSLGVIATNAFASAAHAASDRGWSNPTFDSQTNVTMASKIPGDRVSGDGYGEQVRTRVDHSSNTPYDCLATAAIIFSTAVQDTDDDGLVDLLEDSTSALKDPQDPTGASLLPDLHAMGADSTHPDSTHKDLFVEVGWMYSDSAHVWAAGNHSPGIHSHQPDPDVFRKIGDAFWCAGTADCNAKTSALPSNGIRVHFDAGDSYPEYSGDDAYAERYMIRGSGLARGGEEILEQPCVPTAEVTCQFPAYWGTV